ncbi:putative ABC transport system permease protein [Prosthecobacter fusiformis]|uniref:Putative ABC transport system permease protein n=1 Tax=Prosthecobacter fusiformis TaxID=48464 RepID=A0A4R7SRF6_9BACT|nr:ABC transporter permease [Prosthecobacter fusiformis]TDU81701.1 putative ABC transport system permease protein [Prosthecobacter fusiformis]
MTFFSIVVRGLLRRPVRTALTLVGISLGIAAVVALVGLSEGFEKSWQTGLKVRGTDIVVSNMGGAMVPKPFSPTVRDRVAKIPQVAETCMLMVELMSVEEAEMIMVSAREWGGFTWDNLQIISGRLPKDANEQAVVLGQTAAQVLKKKVGDSLLIEAAELNVVGIVNGGALVEDGSIILALPVLQTIMSSEDKINVVDVRAVPGLTEQELDALSERITTAIPEIRAVSVAHHFNNSQGFKMIRAMSWGTSLLAVLVGVLGVMNTMLMTVFERKQEICVLLAIGWKRGRIVRMVLLESAILGLAGGICGILLGIAGVKIMQATPAIRGLLEADLGAPLLLTALLISVIVGVLSGLYPAWRSSRLNPAAALNG